MGNAVYKFYAETIESAQEQGGFYMSQKRNRKIIDFLIIVIALICVVYMIIFLSTHFLGNTLIGGVDCSYLTADEAVKKVKEETSKKTCSFYFDDDSVEHPTYEEVGLTFNKKMFKELMNEQHIHFWSAREYNINKVSYFDKDALKEYLKQLPEMQKENMIAPQNAQIVWNGEKFSIEPEKNGRQVDVESAVDFAMLQLSNGMGTVYFSLITNSKPDVVTEDLESRRDYLNTILNSYLRFKLSNGEVVVLGKRTIRNWIKEDEKYGYVVNVEEGVDKFVTGLSEKVAKVNKKTLDAEAEKEAIYEALEQTGPVDVELFYIK